MNNLFLFGQPLPKVLDSKVTPRWKENEVIGRGRGTIESLASILGIRAVKVAPVPVTRSATWTASGLGVTQRRRGRVYELGVRGPKLISEGNPCVGGGAGDKYLR